MNPRTTILPSLRLGCSNPSHLPFIREGLDPNPRPFPSPGEGMQPLASARSVTKVSATHQRVAGRFLTQQSCDCLCSLRSPKAALRHLFLFIPVIPDRIDSQTWKPPPIFDEVKVVQGEGKAKQITKFLFSFPSRRLSSALPKSRKIIDISLPFLRRFRQFFVFLWPKA